MNYVKGWYKEAGESVFQARSILQMQNPGLYWDDDARCSTAEPRSAGNIVEVSTLSIFPNPADTVMYLDLTGQLVAEYKGGEGSVSIQHLIQGLYFIRARMADGTMQVTRFVKH